MFIVLRVNWLYIGTARMNSAEIKLNNSIPVLVIFKLKYIYIYTLKRLKKKATSKMLSLWHLKNTVKYNLFSTYDSDSFSCSPLFFRGHRLIEVLM